MHVAERRADWGRYSIGCERLRERWFFERDTRAMLVRQLGDRDPRAGIDPAARLAAAALQGEALESLALDRFDQAHTLAGRASRHLGFSGAARAAQERLEAALSRARWRDATPADRDGARDGDD